MALKTYNGKLIGLDDDTGWKTLIGSGQNAIVYRKRNGIVYVVGSSYGNISTGNNDYKIVATLPVGYRPNYEIETAMKPLSRDICIGFVKSDGTIHLLGYPATTYWRFSVSYPI